MEKEAYPIQSLIGLLESLEAFRSEISDSVTLLLSNTKPSFPWIRQYLGLIPMINKRFGKLVSEIDHPMNIWEGVCVEAYMSYTLCLLDHLNLITSSIARLSHASLWLSHALGLLEHSPFFALHHLNPIQPAEAPIKDHRVGERSKPDGDPGSKKERISHQAIQEVNNLGVWVCGVILSALNGDAHSYLETKKSIGGFADDSSFLASGLKTLDAKMERGVMLEEVEAVNDAVACLESTIKGRQDHEAAAKELQAKLKFLQKEKKKLSKQVDDAFSAILDARYQLLDTIRVS